MKIRSHHGVRHLSLLLAALYAGSVYIYSAADGHSLSDSLWWAFMTFTTVGYGDQYPTSTAGRAAGALLVSAAVFLVIPVITAAIISRFEDKTDEWTHDEQEEVKLHLRELIEWKRKEELPARVGQK